MKKKKILFDATIISNGWAKNSNRSGMFFASLNILKELLKRPEVEISLYCSPAMIRGTQIVLQDIFIKYPNLIIINGNETSFLGNIQNKLIMAKINVNKHKFKLKILSYISLFIKALTILQNKFHHSKILKARLHEFDIYLNPGFLAPKIIRNNKKIKRYTIIYDTIPLLFPNLSPFAKYFGYSWTKSLINHFEADDYCFSISKQTKQDFLDFCPKLIPERIIITPLAASENFYHCIDTFKVEMIKKKYNIPLDKKYIFSLCTLEPRKNLLVVVKCFLKFIEKNNIDDLILVLGGGHHERFSGIIEKELNGIEKYDGQIFFSGYIDDEDLASLYSNAAFFVYPSIYEGFGLPPLEAMQCGCPVISSKTSSLPEVVDDSGLLINPSSEVEFIDAMEKLYFDRDLRQKLSKKGIERAKLFSWEKCVDIMVKTLTN